MIFTALQGYEYYEAGFTIADGVYGSTFFMATGFHGSTKQGPINFNRVVGNPYFRIGFPQLKLAPRRAFGAGAGQNTRNYTTLEQVDTERGNLYPYWVTGFADAESYFSIKIGKRNNDRRTYPWAIIPLFGIELHEKDFFILKQIQKFFGVGTIIHRVRKGNPSIIYSVQSITDIQNIIIPHFKNYPMLTQKQADFELFCMIIDLIEKKEHLNVNGLSKILSIKAAMNKGLSDSLKIAFPNIIPMSRPSVRDQVIKDPYWLVGFVDGEGCFYIKIKKTPQNPQILLTFSISQHTRDKELLNTIKQYLGCGVIETVSTRPNQSTFVTYKFIDNLEKIIPFFKKHSLLSIKLLNFQDFSQAAQLIKNKEHLTNLGIEKFKKLKAGMNTGRSYISRF